MKHLKKFNENRESDHCEYCDDMGKEPNCPMCHRVIDYGYEDNQPIEQSNDEVKIKVKDLIEYLQQFDPETEVELDKNGWDYYYKTPAEIIKHNGLFSPFKNMLFLNN